MLARFSRTSKFANFIVSNLLGLHGHLVMGDVPHMNCHGYYTFCSLRKTHMVFVARTTRTPLQEFFKILAHEIGHMHCKTIFGISDSAYRAQKRHPAEVKNLTWSVHRAFRTKTPRWRSYIGYHYGADQYKRYNGCMEEGVAEGFAQMAKALSQRGRLSCVHEKQPTGRERVSHFLFGKATNDIGMLAVASLVRVLLPQQGLRFGPTQKGRMGLKPGKKHRLHPIQAKAWKMDDRKWV